MGSFIALLIIVAVSLIIVRIGTNALVLTGMSAVAARFQAASAFFGVGFTTSEAEMVMQHQVRRKIILHLIIAGNVGLTSALAAILVSALSISEDPSATLLKLGITAFGLIVIAIGMNLRIVKTNMDKVMRRTLQSAGVKRALDYNLLLNVERGYCVSEMVLEEGHEFVGKTLGEARPADHGVIILGIEKENGSYQGAPNKDTTLCVGDVALMYGHSDKMEAFVKRYKKGETAKSIS